MTTFEYSVVGVAHPPEMDQDRLDELGKNGWRLQLVLEYEMLHYYHFMRERVEEG